MQKESIIKCEVLLEYKLEIPTYNVINKRSVGLEIGAVGK
jgi:hypothetical protein